MCQVLQKVTSGCWRSGDFTESFIAVGPFYSSMDCEVALEEVARRRSELEALMEEENNIIDGMAFFKIEEPHFKPVQLLEKVRDDP